MRRFAAIFVLAAACGPSDEPPDPQFTDDDGCAGDLDRVGDDCVLLSNLMRVLIFQAGDGAYASTCTYSQQSGDPGITAGVVASRGACTVYDEREFGPLNIAPTAAAEPGVVLRRDDSEITIDEGPLFPGCLERTTVPAGFFDAGTRFTVAFDGNGAIPAFNETIALPEDPQFTHSGYSPDRDLVFTWSAIDADIVTATISEGPIQVYCEAQPPAEKLTVPAELLAMIPPSDPPGEDPLVAIRARNTHRLLFAADDAVVALTADTYDATF